MSGVELEKVGLWLFRYRSFLSITAVPLLIAGFWSFGYLHHSHVCNERWQLVCFLISLSGVVLRVFTIGYVPKGTSGRFTHMRVADSLNTTGIYSLVRHPLYLGNYTAVLGIMLFFHQVLLVIVGTLIFSLLYGCIVCSEEAFLKQRFGRAFEIWAFRTPAFIPRLKGWRPPLLPFSWRTVISREYTGLFVVSAAFFGLDFTADTIVERHVSLDPVWLGVFLVSAGVYLTSRTLKKKTSLLSVKGR